MAYALVPLLVRTKVTEVTEASTHDCPRPSFKPSWPGAAHQEAQAALGPTGKDCPTPEVRLPSQAQVATMAQATCDMMHLHHPRWYH